jgi:hypothetical protein
MEQSWQGQGTQIETPDDDSELRSSLNQFFKDLVDENLAFEPNGLKSIVIDDPKTFLPHSKPKHEKKGSLSKGTRITQTKYPSSFAKQNSVCLMPHAIKIEFKPRASTESLNKLLSETPIKTITLQSTSKADSPTQPTTKKANFIIRLPKSNPGSKQQSTFSRDKIELPNLNPPGL